MNGEATVKQCYDMWELNRLAGSHDLTEGLYRGDPRMSYEAAQLEQARELLDEADIRSGRKLLDVGCGYGRLLRAALDRGAAQATGITLSEFQVMHRLHPELDIQILNYKDIPEKRPGWHGHFDGIVANGSGEHFVQPEDALVSGRQDEIYQQMFQTMHAVLKPRGRFITTMIHFLRPPDPRDVLRGHWAHRWDSDSFHWAFLLKVGGAWYPMPGQLEQAAFGYFYLAREREYTEDYLRTSNEWHRRWTRSFLRPTFLKGLFERFIRAPRVVIDGTACLMLTRSWNWQFQGPNPPSKLLHHTWIRCD